MTTEATNRADSTGLEVGQLWAYRARAADPVTCVEVRRIGTARPPRILVKFVDDVYEGRQE